MLDTAIEAVHGDSRRPRQRDAARPHRDGHDHAPAALAGLLQPGRAGARLRHRRRGQVPRRPQRRQHSRSSSASSSSTPTAKTITERTWAGVGLAGSTFPTMTRSRQLLSDVTRRGRARTPPIFRYYAYNTATPPRPDAPLPTPLSATDLARVAKIDDRLHDACRPTGAALPGARRRSRTKSTSASRTPTTQHPHPHAPDPPHPPHPLPICRRARLLHDRRHGRDGGERAVRRRRLRGRQRRPAADAATRRTASRPTRRPRPGSTTTSTTSTRTRTTGPSAPTCRRRTRTENQPVNQTWNGVAHRPAPLAQRRGHDRRSTRSSCCRRNGATACVENNPSTMIDAATGAFRIRVDRAAARRAASSSAASSRRFRRRSFLDFLYFTDFETTDPVNYSSAQPGVGAGQLRRQVPRPARRQLLGDPVRRRRRDQRARSTPTTTS